MSWVEADRHQIILPDLLRDMKKSITSEIARDDQKLKKAAAALVRHLQHTTTCGWTCTDVYQIGEDVEIDEETVGSGEYDVADSSVCAIVVTRNSENGAVRVTGLGNEDENVVTGPRQESGYCIVVVKSGQLCSILGKPTYRFIKRRT